MSTPEDYAGIDYQDLKAEVLRRIDEGRPITCPDMRKDTLINLLVLDDDAVAAESGAGETIGNTDGKPQAEQATEATTPEPAAEPKPLTIRCSRNIALGNGTRKRQEVLAALTPDVEFGVAEICEAIAGGQIEVPEIHGLQLADGVTADELITACRNPHVITID